MPRTTRTYHPKFLAYQKMIVNHPNYMGIPEAIDKDGKIKWVTAGSSALGEARKKWWEGQKAGLLIKGVKLATHADISPTVLAIHPTKHKACQTCGRELSVEYIYPTKGTLNKINQLFCKSFIEDDFLTIIEIITALFHENGPSVFKKIAVIFPGLEKINDLHDAHKFLRENFIEVFSRKLSPGAMSNCPDRLDGYHSYNRCCRANEDTGRHASNLNRYGEDRRAYEHWSDGDWKAASWLMKVFVAHGISADHIGPISLGFAHRPTFNPMSRAANSAKNNRMTYADVQKLLKDEDNNECVISWHSKPIWDRLKVHVASDQDALQVSKYMRQNMHDILTILAALNQAGLEELLLSFLSPEHAYYSIEFEGFDPITGGYTKMVKVKGTKTQYSRNAERYQRIAFDFLDAYTAKGNRRSKKMADVQLQKIIDTVKDAYAMGGKPMAYNVLMNHIELLALDAEKNFLAGKILNDQLLDD